MLKIRRPLGRLIFNMGIAIPGKTVFLIETAPSFPLKSTWLSEFVSNNFLQCEQLKKRCTYLSHWPIDRPISQISHCTTGLFKHKRNICELNCFWFHLPSHCLFNCLFGFHLEEPLFKHYLLVFWFISDLNWIWTHHKHPISHPHMWAMECLLWVLWTEKICWNYDQTVSGVACTNLLWPDACLLSVLL